MVKVEKIHKWILDIFVFSKVFKKNGGEKAINESRFTEEPGMI
jgi:hypothetical protein